MNTTIEINTNAVSGKLAEYLALEALDIYNGTQVVMYEIESEEEANELAAKECLDAIELFEKAVELHKEKNVDEFLKSLKDDENPKPWTLGIYNRTVAHYMPYAYQMYNDYQVEKDTPENIKRCPIPDEVVELARACSPIAVYDANEDIDLNTILDRSIQNDKKHQEAKAREESYTKKLVAIL